MANAIKKISVQRGYDVTRYALNCFGGAGGQHACLVADALGMTEVLIHPFSSLLSAYGMGLADIRATRQLAIEENLGAKALAAIKRDGGRLGKDAKAEVAGQGVPAAKIKVIVRAHIRYAGTDTPLIVEAGTLAKMKSAFEKAHKARFGFIDRSKQLVVEAVSVEAVGGGAKFSERKHKTTRTQAPLARPHDADSSRTANGTTPRSTPASSFRPATRSKAPPSSSSRTRPSCSRTAGAPRSPRRTISCSSASSRSSAPRRSAPRPIRSCSRCSTTCSCRSPSRWACRCRTPPIRSTSRSGSTSPARCFPPTARSSPTRRTCRCISARWTARSKPSSARTRAKSAPGDSYLINAPYNGGTHIPDLTVCTPVFDRAKKKILFWVASRGHHADIGGIAPGSMSPIATSIEEEGIYIDNFKLVDRGKFREPRCTTC